MPRIAGVNIPEEKLVKVSLTYIYGIGSHISEKILNDLNIDLNTRTKELAPAQVQKLQQEIEKLLVEGGLRQTVRNNIESLKRIKAYRGLRHSMGLPSRGQRTRTNARTKKGKKKTVGAMTKDTRVKLEGAK